MKRMIAVVFVMLSVLCVHQAAFAGESTDASISDVTEYKFTDDTVTGDLVGTEGVSILARPNGAARSLIKVRLHFVKELLKSVETL